MAGLAHFGPGFAAKHLAPKVPVVVLVLAGELLDFLYFGFAAIGLEPVNGVPFWTHSLVMAVAWSLLTGGLTALVSRSFRGGLVLGLVVASHWVVDAITHPMTAFAPTDTAGMPLFLGATPAIGLGLYRSFIGGILFEAVFLLGGIALYVVWRRKRAKAPAA